MADEVWKELAESAELKDAMSSLRAETMPASVARQILHALPPGGGGGPPASDADSAASTAGSSSAGWAIAAVTLCGVLGAGWLWYSSASVSTSAAQLTDAANASDHASARVSVDPIQAQTPAQPAKRAHPSGVGAAHVEATRAEAIQQAPPRPSRATTHSDEQRAQSSAQDVNEIQLLEQARSLLGAHPSRALRLLRLHARRFPQSQLTQERELLRIEALVSGRHPERAIRLAERFLSRYPSSAQRGRVEALRDRARAP